MKQVTPQPKDGKVFTTFQKTENGISARVSFIDQFGIERVRHIAAARSDFAFKVVESVFNGTAKIIAPEPPTQNAYDHETR